MHQSLRTLTSSTWPIILFMAFMAMLLVISPARADSERPDASRLFLDVLDGDFEAREKAIEYLESDWRPSDATLLVETLRFIRYRPYYNRLIALLEKQTGQDLGVDSQRWLKWIWSRDYAPDPDYANFKSRLYREIDETFAGYFDNNRTASIRLDQVVWGGVLQDGIPPLRQPNMIDADEADYLDDSHIVFGIEVNGDVRAYPKRILAWHEMFVDEVGGVPVVGVYCTLCGTVILYDSVVDGVNHQMGTSGFLYRSNKLMYDEATQSLWNTFEGKPVIGPLVGQGIEFSHRYVVTTTWGEWKRRHPDSKVLDLVTGYRRDYGEGVAYQDYFATDALMFAVPEQDQRLNNKDEILGLVFPEHPDRPMAIAVEFLDQNPIYHDAIGKVSFVALTDTSGAIRVYENPGLTFETWDRQTTATDSTGQQWTLTEPALVAADGRELSRLPANRAFWFGWYAFYNHTRLVR